MVVAAIEGVDQVQRKHSKGMRKQMQDIRAQGARASTTRSRRHAVSANTSRLANTQTKARYAQAGAENAQTGRTCSASTRARRNATHENGGGWPDGAQIGQQVEARGRRLGLVFEPARRTTGLRASGCRSCRRFPFLCVFFGFESTQLAIWPKTGAFRGVFWMIRFSTFCTKTHFPENQKS